MSERREALLCPHRPPCPGCPRFGEPGIAPTAFAALEALARTHDLPGVPVVSGATHAFRLRARLAIRGRQGAPKLGMFQLGTHRVVSIPNCSHSASADQSRRCGRSAGARRCRRGPLFGSGPPRPRALSAGRRRAQLADRTGRAGRQLSDRRAAGKVPGSDPRAARQRAAQPVVQRPLRAVQRDPGGRSSRTGAGRPA